MIGDTMTKDRYFFTQKRRLHHIIGFCVALGKHVKNTKLLVAFFMTTTLGGMLVIGPVPCHAGTNTVMPVQANHLSAPTVRSAHQNTDSTQRHVSHHMDMENPEDDLALEATISSPADIADPFEGINRATYGLNTALDMMFIKPIATLYKALTPYWFKDRIDNVLTTLATPAYTMNYIFQGHFHHASHQFWRLMVNGTAGVAGMFDVAAKAGILKRPTDFGQTLAHYHMPHICYLVLPVIGASSLRDAIGLGIDALSQPLRYLTHRDAQVIYYATLAVDRRYRLFDAVDPLIEQSIDEYATIRSGYAQYRDAMNQ